MVELSEYDQRQLGVLQSKFKLYRAGDIGLGVLIGNVHGLAGVVEDPAIESILATLSWELEFIYSDMVQRTRQASHIEVAAISSLLSSAEESLGLKLP